MQFATRDQQSSTVICADQNGRRLSMISVVGAADEISVIDFDKHGLRCIDFDWLRDNIVYALVTSSVDKISNDGAHLVRIDMDQPFDGLLDDDDDHRVSVVCFLSTVCCVCYLDDSFGEQQSSCTIIDNSSEWHTQSGLCAVPMRHSHSIVRHNAHVWC
jgi:hypothetical protein